MNNIKKYLFMGAVFTFLLSFTILASDKTDSPHGIRVVYTHNNKVYIEWEQIENVDYYNIYQCNEKNGSFKMVYKTHNNLYTIENIKPGEKIFYKIASVKNNEESKFSDIIYVQMPKPNPPESIYISTLSNSAIYLRWDEPHKSDYYIIYRSNSAKGNYKEIGRTDVNMYVDAGLRPFTPYFYKIKSEQDGVKSSFSKVVYSTTD